MMGFTLPADVAAPRPRPSPPAGRQHGRDELSAAIVLRGLRAEQAWPRVAAACVGAVAELTVRGVDRFPARERSRVRGSTLRERASAATAALARLLCVDRDD